MKRSLTVFIATLAACCAATVASAQTKVGVANLQKIFSELKETKDIRSRFEARVADLNNSRNAERAELERLQKERDEMYRPDSPEFSQRTREMFLRFRQSEARFEFENGNLVREQKLSVRQMVNKIIGTTERIAKEQGYQLILTVNQPTLSDEDLNRATPEQVSATLGQRNPLYFSEEIDISSLVIARLDADYEASKSATTPNP